MFTQILKEEIVRTHFSMVIMSLKNGAQDWVQKVHNQIWERFFSVYKAISRTKNVFLRDLCVERLTARLGAGHNGKAE